MSSLYKASLEKWIDENNEICSCFLNRISSLWGSQNTKKRILFSAFAFSCNGKELVCFFGMFHAFCSVRKVFSHFPVKHCLVLLESPYKSCAFFFLILPHLRFFLLALRRLFFDFRYSMLSVKDLCMFFSHMQSRGYLNFEFF